MSYVKKDEDADQVMIKLDRTTVFQDGRRSLSPEPELPSPSPILTTSSHSEIVQFFAYIASKMPYPPDQDRRPPVHRREVPDERGHDTLLRHLQALPE